jgi:nitroreductase
MDTTIFQKRFAARKYTNKPVSKELLTKVLTDAMRSPSWANSQPWELYIAAGDTLEQLRSACVQSFENNEPGHSDIPYPKHWPDYLQDRINRAYEHNFKSRGIDRNDKQARYESWKNNYRFFEAPVAVFLCMDASLSEWSTLDIGIFVGHLMLAATAHGLDSTPSASSVVYPHHIRRILGVPDNKKIIVGVMMGYRDSEHIYNKGRSERVPLEEVVHFKGI